MKNNSIQLYTYYIYTEYTYFRSNIKRIILYPNNFIDSTIQGSTLFRSSPTPSIFPLPDQTDGFGKNKFNARLGV